MDSTSRSPVVSALLEARDEPFPLWKRASDIFLCLLALPALGVLTLLAATIVALLSPGPVFYAQERVGYRGRRFRCFKFRTMRVGASTRKHQELVDQMIRSNLPMTKLDARGDDRLIPGARLIRALGLDELPQVVNVLRGEMSVVGPRPALDYEVNCYQPWQRGRLNARPGLTGLWQVSGKNRTTFEEMVRLDLHYIWNLSPTADLRILAKTLPAVCGQLRWVTGRPAALPAAQVSEQPTV